MEDSYITAPRKRPGALTVLLMLSTLASLWNIITNTALVSFTADIKNNRQEIEEQMLRSVEEMGVNYLGEDLPLMLSQFLDHCPLLPVIGLITAMLTLVGVTFMFRLRSAGFHIYTVAKILDTALPAVLAGSAFFSFFTLLSNALFVFLYSTYLNRMR